MPARDPRGADRFDAAGAAGPLPSLTHEPFFAALANLEGSEDSAEWRATVAGLVTLRLVDRCVSRPTRIGSALPPDLVPEVLEAAQRAVDAVDAHEAVSEPLRQLLRGAASGDHARLAHDVLAYAHALELDARWPLAADAYRTALTILHTPHASNVPALESWIPVTYDRLGRALRMMGDLDGARVAYTSARSIARALGDHAAELRVRISEAKMIAHVGNIPAAIAELDAIIAAAEAVDRKYRPTHTMTPGMRIAGVVGLEDPIATEDVAALARHDRGLLATDQKDFAVAIEHYFAAWRAYRDPGRRERVWVDLARTLADMGLHDAARDAYTALYATARQREARLVAATNLLELAAADGRDSEFDTYRKVLAEAADAGILPARLAAWAALYEGQGECAFGRPERGALAFERAQSVAARHRVNEVLILADQALAALAAGRTPRDPELCRRAPPLTPAVERITRALRRVRRRAGAGAVAPQ